mmetsp:Transcript_5633/g.18293  ORF Transcript_5633/g.18293 Transcript_5633/m.18293 type:complete len:102 (-) Transcript_5633:177-482(-)
MGSSASKPPTLEQGVFIHPDLLNETKRRRESERKLAPEVEPTVDVATQSQPQGQSDSLVDARLSSHLASLETRFRGHDESEHHKIARIRSLAGLPNDEAHE